MRAWLLFVALFCVAPLAVAAGHTVPSAYTRAAQAHAVPPVMLYALSLTESGTTLSFGRRPWPWTLNIAGDGKRYATRQAACQALTAALKSTRIIDVGIGQLNVYWQKTLFGPAGRFAEPCAALNPYANLDAAATILRDCFERTGSWFKAAGCYHRPAGGAPAARYRAAFRKQLAWLRDGPVRVAKASGPAPRMPTAAPHVVAQAVAYQQSAPAEPATAASRITWVNPTRGHHALD